MSTPSRPHTFSLQEEILQQLETILQEATDKVRPLELEPARGELFNLFVTAHGAGFLEEEAEIDLTADELCKILSQRWGLDQSAQQAMARQEKLAEQDLAKMRLLWSLMRMWMEWTYAWQRYEEFQTPPQNAPEE